MKKFLTVLLALSVVFTYSFSTVGSVFAAEKTEYTPAEFEVALENVVDGYKSTLNGNITRVKALYSYDEDGFTTIGDVKVSADAVAEGIDAFIAELVEAMNGKVDKALEADKETYLKSDYDAAKAAIEEVIIGVGAKEAEDVYTVQDVKYPDKVTGLFDWAEGKFTPVKVEYPTPVGNTEYYKLTKKQLTVGEAFPGGSDKYAVQTSVEPEEYAKPTELTVGAEKVYYKWEKVTLYKGDNVKDLYKKNGNAYEQITTDTNAVPGTIYYVKSTTPAVEGLDYLEIADFKAGLEKTAYIVKAEEPKSESYYKTKINTDFDEAKYSENKNTFTVTIDEKEETLTAQEMVSYAKETALTAIKDAKKALSAVQTPAKADYEKAINAYAAAYTTATAFLANVKNNDQIADEETDKVIDVEAAVAKLRLYAVGKYYDGMKVAKDASITSWKTAFGTDIYVEDAAAKTYTVFGVKVANPAKVTESEAKALNAALYAAIKDTLSVAEVTLSGVKKGASDADYTVALNAKLAELYNSDDNAKFSKTVADAYVITDIYQDVVDYSAKLKNTYKFGEKIYDDAKVDAVVKAAEAVVYADLAKFDDTKDAEVYFAEAIKVVYGADAVLADLELDHSNALAKFEKAQEDARNKFNKPIINYGEDKTPEADKKYKASIYAAGAVTADDESYTDIKNEAIKAINAAQSYADIDAAFAVADAKLAQLLTKENEAVIEKLRDSYENALEAYKLEKVAFLDMSAYDGTDFTDAVVKGKALINKAGTEDTIKAAFEKAKALVDAVKTTEAVNAEKTALEDMLKALPLASKVTLEHKADIEAARAAYDAYTDVPGVPAVSDTKLNAAEGALAVLEKVAIEKELDALEKEIKAIGTVDDDKAAEAAVALKGKAEALQEKIDAHNDSVEELKLDAAKKIRESTALDKFLSKADRFNSAYYAEIYLVEKAIAAIDPKVGTASPAAVKEAKKMFDALTDKQQYILDNCGCADKLAAAIANIAVQVESLKIKVSTKLYTKSNKIRVNWKTTGVAEAADGYYVYKSTKAQTGYKFMGKTTKNYMDNKKNLKKGQRYFYKVKAYVEIDGVKYFSDDSNKGNRIYK